MASNEWVLPTEIKSERTKFDPLSRSVSMITEEHRMVHEGFFFYCYAAILGLANDAHKYMVIRTGDVPPHFKGIDIQASQGGVNFTLYERAETSPQFDPLDLSPNAVPIVVNNANFLSGNVSGLRPYTMDEPPPWSPLGEHKGTLQLPVQSAAAKGSVTGDTKVPEVVMQANRDYLIDVHNDPAATGAVDVFIQFSHYEINWTD